MERLKRRPDPTIIYGPGIKNYFRLQELLLMGFFLYSLLAWGQIEIFKSFEGLSNFDYFVNGVSTGSLGNIGFSGSVCNKRPIDWLNRDSLTLRVKCEATTQISGLLSSGMMLDDGFPGGNDDAVHNCYIDPDNEEKMASFEMQ